MPGGEAVARRGDVEASILMVYNVGFIRKYLPPDSAKIIVQALLFLNLKYCVTRYFMVFLLMLFKSYNTFRTQQPVS